MNKLNFFTYGTLKLGLRFHYYLENAHFIKETTLSNFQLYDYGPFPYAIKTDNPKHIIQVEQYEIDEIILLQMDRLEGYPSLFTRTEVKSNEGIIGWIYHADKNEAKRIKKMYPLVKSGNWTPQPEN